MSDTALGQALVALKTLVATGAHQLEMRDQAIRAVEAALARHAPGRATFLDVRERRPPTAQRVLLLTPAKVCIIGPFTGWEIGWHPIPEVPESLKGGG